MINTDIVTNVSQCQMFETILIKRFEKLRGRTKVLRKEYAIEDSRSGQELNRRREWSMLFRPGQKVDMSIIFKQSNTSTSCPGCQTESRAACDSVTEWYFTFPLNEYLRLPYHSKKCGIFFRQIEDINDPIQHPAQIVPSRPDLSSQFQLRSAVLQTTMPEAIEDSISDFKRVRLHFQRCRSNGAVKKLEPIKFKDAIGRKFSFPFHLCHHWFGMEELILQSFKHDIIIGPYVRKRQYDLVSINGEIILPQYWDARIRPGMSITMLFWPLLLGDFSQRSRNPQHQPSYSPPDPDNMDIHVISPISSVKVDTEENEGMKSLHAGPTKAGTVENERGKKEDGEAQSQTLLEVIPQDKNLDDEHVGVRLGKEMTDVGSDYRITNQPWPQPLEPGTQRLADELEEVNRVSPMYRRHTSAESVSRPSRFPRPYPQEVWI
jgi:hypothetical protein